jgi:hypothetical protein
LSAVVRIYGSADFWGVPSLIGSFRRRITRRMSWRIRTSGA